MKRNYLALLLMIVAFFLSCTKPNPEPQVDHEENLKIEKDAILETIREETKAAFGRDYESWKSNWVQDPTISKTYLNFVDNTFSEMIGWKEIDDFVRTYIEEHPKPIPPPDLPKNVEVRLYKNGAWLQYEMMDKIHGLKRETRLMEKENGQWKIAGMHTSIYGFQTNK